jgi:MFS transporter, DHA2 family, multidrug resistance protein
VRRVGWFRDRECYALGLAAGAVIYGIKRIAEGEQVLLAVTAMVLGSAIGIVFGRRQRMLADPLIDLSLFRSPAFTASLLINVLGFFVAFGTFLFIAQYLQLVLGMSPLRAGLWTAPSGVAFIAGSMLAPVLARRMAPTRVIACGFAVAAVGFAVLTQIGRSDGPSVVVSAYVILSLGLAPVFTMATDVIVGLAPPERAGMAAALSETSTEFGGALDRHPGQYRHRRLSQRYGFDHTNGHSVCGR